MPLGASNSFKNMLIRSLGAGQFSIFWKYWNPIWGFYLGKYIFKPLKTVLSPKFALILTFVFCGFLHDLVIIILRRHFELLLTPWFLFMGLCVVLSDYKKINYSKYPWGIRAFINILIILSCLLIAYKVRI